MSNSNPTAAALPGPSSHVGTMDAQTLIERLTQLRRGSTAEIDWNLYCALMRQLCRAEHAAVVHRVADSEAVELAGRSSEQEGWSPLQTLPAGMDLFEKASVSRHAHAPAQAADGKSWLVLVVALQGLPSWYLILNIRTQERGQLNELTVRALLCSSFEAAAPGAARATTPAELSGMLGLAAEVMQQQQFDTACLALVNGITMEWGLIQASLGWADRDGVKVAAISHLDRFERNSSQARLLEGAMASALIQGHEVWWPQTDPDAHEDLAMADFAAEVGVQRVVAIPMRDAQGITHAVLLLAFAPDAAPAVDLNHLQLSLELVQPRLFDLWLRSLGPWERFQRKITGWSEELFGPEHALLKLGSVLVALLLLYALLGHWDYRVDASAQLDTEATRLISAQYDGRIDQVYTTAGELVKQGALLVTLDTRELTQQQSELQAEIAKSETEVNKHRAEAHLAETEIAQARLEQSLAKARRVDYYLGQSQSRAPFDGVVVEGERKELLGAPVKKGDKIFRIAKVEGLYVTLMVSERQMRYIASGASGEVSLLSHPQHSIPIRVSSVIPVAQVKGQEGNQFMITAQLLETAQDWWRPGMTGLARIDAGSRNIAWILTHRALDHLRLLLWW